jgi:two-component system sensor histidine kinase MtrB
VPGGTSLWSFFPLDEVFEDLDDLRRVLAAAALVMVALSAMVGAAAARPLLHPIAIARDAAQRLEAGDLSTRVPEEGSDELAELSRTLNGMAAALERTVVELRRAEAGHRRFVADVSHELRTPVTALATAAEFLAPRLPTCPEPERRAAKVMVDEAVRLGSLVEDLMEISRMDAGVAVVEEDLIDLRRLVVGAVEERGWGGRVVAARPGAGVRRR